MSAMYKLAVFDMDGTLLNTLDDLCAAGNYALAAFGLPLHVPDDFRGFVGSGVYTLVKRMLPPMYRDDAEMNANVLAAYREYYAAHSLDFTRPYDGILEALSKIHGSGVSIAILSNKPHSATVYLSEHFFSGLVDLAYGQRDGLPLKPDPAAVYDIMRHFGVTKEECVYIGDSDVDMLTGKNAGVATIGALWGYCTKSQLLEHGDTVIISETQDLVKKIIDNSTRDGYTVL